MTWREDLRRVPIDGRQLVGASFRGVPFFVAESERAGGRRVVVHEFPLLDDPFVEDLGRKARTFRVDGYVLGDDYLVQRDTLLAALEDTADIGELVHPYFGVKRAICASVSVSEGSKDGGFAKFSIEFAEAPTQTAVPVAFANLSDLVSDSADAAQVATKGELIGQYRASNLPDHALASASTAIGNAATALKAQLAPVISDTQEAAQLTGQVALITAQASSLARQPAVILGKFQDAIAGLVKTLAASPGGVMNGLLAAYAADFGAPVIATTVTRTQEATNQAALTSALRRVFAIEAARLAPTVPYVSIDDATAARDELTIVLDEQAGLAGDTAYPALVDLRAQVLQAVPGGTAFASIVTVTRRVPIPSLVLAYQLYGAVDLELDIVARNNIRNPGFVFGELKVLSA